MSRADTEAPAEEVSAWRAQGAHEGRTLSGWLRSAANAALLSGPPDEPPSVPGIPRPNREPGDWPPLPSASTRTIT